MKTVIYSHEFQYRNLPEHTGLFPAVVLRLSANANKEFDTIAVFDTGASRTIFAGQLTALIGLNLEDGPVEPIYTVRNDAIITRVHPVVIEFNGCRFELDVCFTEQKIVRNLLGRDLLAKLQIGFRENHHTFLVLPTP